MRDPPGDPPEQVDLHGLSPEDAERRLSQALHAARVRGLRSLRVVTGRGWGNLRQEPVLRRRIERFLAGPAGARFGVRSVRVVAKGGALDLVLG